MKSKAEHRERPLRYDTEQFKASEQHLFFNTLLLGVGCLLVWLLMSVML